MPTGSSWSRARRSAAWPLRHSWRAAWPRANSKGHLAALIPATLWLEVKPIRVERVDATSWRLGTDEPLVVDERGLPVLRGGEVWPLERDGETAPRHR